MQPGVTYKWEGIKFRGDAVGGAYAISRERDVPSWVRNSPLRSARIGGDQGRQQSPAFFNVENSAPGGSAPVRARSVSPLRFWQTVQHGPGGGSGTIYPNAPQLSPNVGHYHAQSPYGQQLNVCGSQQQHEQAAYYDPHQQQQQQQPRHQFNQQQQQQYNQPPQQPQQNFGSTGSFPQYGQAQPGGGGGGGNFAQQQAQPGPYYTPAAGTGGGGGGSYPSYGSSGPIQQYQQPEPRYQQTQAPKQGATPAQYPYQSSQGPYQNGPAGHYDRGQPADQWSTQPQAANQRPSQSPSRGYFQGQPPPQQQQHQNVQQLSQSAGSPYYPGSGTGGQHHQSVNWSDYGGSDNQRGNLTVNAPPNPQYNYKSSISIGTLSEYAHPPPSRREASRERHASPFGKKSPDWSTSCPYEVDPDKEADEILNQPYRTRPIVKPGIKPAHDRIEGSYLTGGMARVGVPQGRGDTPQEKFAEFQASHQREFSPFQSAGGNIIIGAPVPPVHTGQSGQFYQQIGGTPSVPANLQGQSFPQQQQIRQPSPQRTRNPDPSVSYLPTNIPQNVASFSPGQQHPQG